MRPGDRGAFEAFARAAAEMLRVAFVGRVGFRLSLSPHGDGAAELLDEGGEVAARAEVRGRQLSLPFGVADASQAAEGDASPLAGSVAGDASGGTAGDASVVAVPRGKGPVKPRAKRPAKGGRGG